jgi:hypothetical protein
MGAALFAAGVLQFTRWKDDASVALPLAVWMRHFLSTAPNQFSAGLPTRRGVLYLLYNRSAGRPRPAAGTAMKRNSSSWKAS